MEPTTIAPGRNGPPPLERADILVVEGLAFLVKGLVLDTTYLLLTANFLFETQQCVLRLSALFKGGGPAEWLVVGSDPPNTKIQGGIPP
jgi:hypothetical protein